jgi:arsenate reductase (thioredoxin)
MTNGEKKKVLFVCLGNSCRSQMAEAFARTYGADVIVAASAGLMPAAIVAPDTARAMREKNIDMRAHFPKHIRQLGRAHFDLIVNMSGDDLPYEPGDRIIAWEVDDPIRLNFKEHCEVRDKIERLVMDLLLEFRREAASAEAAGGV